LADRGANPTEPGSESRSPFTHTDDTAEQATSVANALANRYLESMSELWKRRTDATLLKTRQATENANRAYSNARDQLAAYCRQLEEAAQAAAKAQARNKTPAILRPTMIDNPQWSDLNNQLTILQRRRDELLIDRTPLHPAVQDVSARIASINEQMVDVPRRISASQDGPVNVAGLPIKSELPEANSSPEEQSARSLTAQDQDKLDQLTAVVEQTRRDYAEAELAEKLALQAQQAGPRLSIEATQIVEIPPQPDFGWRRLMATTFATALLMALGFGSFATGTAIELPVMNTAQLKTDIDKPILGNIPATEPIADSAAISRRSRVRHTLMALGLIFMGVCPIVAIWGMMGI